MGKRKTFKNEANDIFILLVTERQPILFPVSATLSFFIFLFEGLISLIHTLQHPWHHVNVILKHIS